MVKRKTRTNVKSSQIAFLVALPVVILGIVLVSYLVNSSWLTFSSHAAAPQSAQTSYHLGPGELSDIQITTSNVRYNNNQYNYTSTFTISGARVQSYDSLQGNFNYFISDNGPRYQTINFTLNKANNQFTATLVHPNEGCIDLLSPSNNYIASFCMQSNPVSYNNPNYGASGGDTWTPFIYSGGHYIWGQNHARMTIAYSVNLPPQSNYDLESLTMAFDKNQYPYYQQNSPDSNFKPTNFYWIAQDGLKYDFLSTEYWFKSDASAACNDPAKFGTYPNMIDTVGANYYDIPPLWYNNACWYHTQSYTLPYVDNQYFHLSLIPSSITSCDTDINNDGVTDIIDYSIMRKQFGCDTHNTSCIADINHDTIVNDTDFQIFQTYFGQTCTSPHKPILSK